MPKIKFIDNEEDYNKVLYELRLLDDDDDYPLFCKMQSEDFYKEQDETIYPEIELYIIKNKLYRDYSNPDYTRDFSEFLFVKNHKTNEIHHVSESVYFSTQRAFSLENKLIENSVSKQIKSIKI